MNLVTNRVARILGKVENTERFLRVALYQGIPKQGVKTQQKLATTESSRTVTRQPTLLCTAYNKQRLYLFTTQEPDDSDQASTSRCAPSPVSVLLKSLVAVGQITVSTTVHYEHVSNSPSSRGLMTLLAADD